MRKEFYIFRHGQTDYNAQKRWQGQALNTGLNEAGIKQAECLADELVDKDIEVIFSSPLKRAKQTAEIVAEKLDVDIIVSEDLKEGCFGDAEGLTKEEVKVKFAKEYEEFNSFNRKTYDCKLPGGESKKEILDRMLSALDEIISTDYGVIGVSIHSRIAKLFLYMIGAKIAKVKNAKAYHVLYSDGSWELLTK